MEDILGTSVAVWVGLTLFLFGGAAYMSGRALAVTWRPFWQAVPYMLMLGLARQFLSFALFQGPLLHLVSYVISTAVLFVICYLSFTFNRNEMMARQYPWLYERSGLIGLRAKNHGEAG
ncbi:DUF6867 family protein [Oceanibacterium hippocampi]|uniref:DUF6867 domain-containing protein n=1 Tax=Oceanibacterium hippocampi TaxID=745714 RepID=A0A1Y5SRE5_9PROT|nr:hypothetical protein [Oceanibacterium hippocampi]SLN44814.1 hypothetical protein OCH7691_01907 [Oceanibacterium hippocampi]